MSQPPSNPSELDENQRLERLLRRVLRQAAFRPKNAKSVQILDLACGECREAETLLKVVACPTEGAIERPEARLVAADIRNREVGIAAERFKPRPGAKFEFLVEDASRLDRNREIGEGFDLAFLRHQNYWHQPTLWKRIFSQGLAKLSEDGLLVITSYFDREHELAKRALDHVGAELIATHRNADSIQLATPGKSIDRHIAVFRRRR